MRVLVEAEMWGGYSISSLRRIVSYLSTTAVAVTAGALWRLLAFILRSVPSAGSAYSQLARSASRAYGVSLPLVW